MNDMYKAMKKLQEIKSTNSITLDEFLNTIKVEEINMYQDIVNKYHALNSRRSEYEPKNDSEQEYEKWRNFIKRLNDISEDYYVLMADYIDSMNEIKDEMLINSTEIARRMPELVKSIQETNLVDFFGKCKINVGKK